MYVYSLQILPNLKFGMHEIKTLFYFIRPILLDLHEWEWKWMESVLSWSSKLHPIFYTWYHTIRTENGLTPCGNDLYELTDTTPPPPFKVFGTYSLTLMRIKNVSKHSASTYQGQYHLILVWIKNKELSCNFKTRVIVPRFNQNALFKM